MSTPTFISGTGCNGSRIAAPGGEFDRGVTGADVYLDMPSAAKIPPGKACQMAQRYVDLVNSGDSAELAELFEADVVLLDQIGENALGYKQIEAYFMAIARFRPRIIAVAFTGDDVDCMVAIATEMKIQDQPRYVLAAVDHFTLGMSGKISRLVAFGRPFGLQNEGVPVSAPTFIAGSGQLSG